MAHKRHIHGRTHMRHMCKWSILYPTPGPFHDFCGRMTLRGLPFSLVLTKVQGAHQLHVDRESRQQFLHRHMHCLGSRATRSHFQAASPRERTQKLEPKWLRGYFVRFIFVELASSGPQAKQISTFDGVVATNIVLTIFINSPDCISHNPHTMIARHQL